jgi:hypothetical protein
MTRFDRARERDEVDAPISDHPSDVLVSGPHIGEHAGWPPDRGPRFAIALSAEQRLHGVLEDHRVPGQECGDDRVHRGQVRVVPRGDDEDGPDGFPADEAGEAGEAGRVADADIGHRSIGNRHHVSRSFLEPAANLVR